MEASLCLQVRVLDPLSITALFPHMVVARPRQPPCVRWLKAGRDLHEVQCNHTHHRWHLTMRLCNIIQRQGPESWQSIHLHQCMLHLHQSPWHGSVMIALHQSLYPISVTGSGMIARTTAAIRRTQPTKLVRDLKAPTWVAEVPHLQYHGRIRTTDPTETSNVFQSVALPHQTRPPELPAPIRFDGLKTRGGQTPTIDPANTPITRRYNTPWNLANHPSKHFHSRLSIPQWGLSPQKVSASLLPSSLRSNLGSKRWCGRPRTKSKIATATCVCKRSLPLERWMWMKITMKTAQKKLKPNPARQILVRTAGIVRSHPGLTQVRPLPLPKARMVCRTGLDHRRMRPEGSNV